MVEKETFLVDGRIRIASFVYQGKNHYQIMHSGEENIIIIYTTIKEENPEQAKNLYLAKVLREIGENRKRQSLEQIFKSHSSH